MDRASDSLGGIPQPLGAVAPPQILTVAKEQPVLNQVADKPEREEMVKALTSIQNLTSLLHHLDQLARAGELTSTTYLARDPPDFEPVLQGVEP